jgi:hypothetical protein
VAGIDLQSSTHPLIKEETYAEFLLGGYETGKTVGVAVRAGTSVPSNIVGQDSMVKAFHVDTGTLSLLMWIVHQRIAASIKKVRQAGSSGSVRVVEVLGIESGFAALDPLHLAPGQGL